ncbi:ribosome-binding factor A [Thiovulum sp. ES]|nr:ribosome-binding factor A [Thiovulum sp. ES]
MKKSEQKIKVERTEAILLELIPEAISTLSDDRISGLAVVDVVCSRGRDDAKVYLDSAFVEENEKGRIVSQLSKARGVIERYCASEQGWFKSPKLSFEFDTLLQKESKIEELFKKIQKD